MLLLKIQKTINSIRADSNGKYSRSLINKIRTLKRVFIIFAFVLIGALHVKAGDTLCTVRMEQANMYLKGYLKPYNPAKALDLYLECAKAGNADAMNIVATIYGTGKGVNIDMNKAREWYEKSALGGNSKAWFNLGMIYKYAQGVDQDYTKAFDCFRHAADNNLLSGIYACGYMLYKGFGCKQNYIEAINYFTRGAYSNELGCMFMLGLCNRNGYGVVRDTLKAKYWLEKAIDGGYKDAKDEILIPVAENKDLKNSTKIINEIKDTTINTQTFFSIIQNRDKIEGIYVGQIIIYDWSEQYIINIHPLSLIIEIKGPNIIGKWTEQDNPTTEVGIQLSESAFIFNQYIFSRTNRSQINNSVSWQLKNMRLNAFLINSVINLSGKFQLYSEEKMEPGNPCYIKLEKEINSTKK